MERSEAHEVMEAAGAFGASTTRKGREKPVARRTRGGGIDEQHASDGLPAGDLLAQLADVPRTMLWTLHCRASFAERGYLHDPLAIRLRAQLGMDLARTFGRPDPAFAARAQIFDRALQAYIDEHPDSVTVISLGEGLETQHARVRGYKRWISLDLPEAMEIRRALIPEDETHELVCGSALDLSWVERAEAPCFVVAQGLFMYLPEDGVRSLLGAWAERGPGALMFDVIPAWLSLLSRTRVPMTTAFRLPFMPWGGSARRVVQMVQQATAPLNPQLDLDPCPLPSGPMPFSGRTWVVKAVLRS